MNQGRNDAWRGEDPRDGGVQTDDRWQGRGGADRDAIAGGRDRDMTRGEVGTYGNQMQQHGGYGRNDQGNYGDRGRWDRNDQQPGGGNYGGSSRDYYGQGYSESQRPSHRGKGPANYQRSDERIKEHVSEALMEHHEIDASNVHVEVKDGELTLTGTVTDRNQRRMIEDVVEGMTGIRDIHMTIKLANQQGHKSATSSNGPDYENRTPDNKKARA